MVNLTVFLIVTFLVVHTSCCNFAAPSGIQKLSFGPQSFKFKAWSMRMKIYLQALDLWHEDSRWSEYSPDYSNRINRQAIHVLMSHLEDSAVLQVHSALGERKTSKQIWELIEQKMAEFEY